MTEIFNDGFESGDAGAWDYTDGEEYYAVTNAAALEGAYGLAVTNPLGRSLVEADFAPITRCRCAFRFDPNGLVVVPGLSNYIEILEEVFMSVNLRQIAGAYYIFQESYNLSDTTTGADFLVTDAPHVIEVDWKYAANADSNDGFCKLWIDGVLKEELLNLDNWNPTSDGNEYCIIGIPYQGPALFTGTLYVDNMIANDDGSQIIVVEPPPAEPASGQRNLFLTNRNSLRIL